MKQTKKHYDLRMRRERAIDAMVEADINLKNKTEKVVIVETQIYSEINKIYIGTPIYYTSDYREFVWGVVIGFEIFKPHDKIKLVVAVVDSENYLTAKINFISFTPFIMKKGMWNKIKDFKKIQALIKEKAKGKGLASSSVLEEILVTVER